ncbi:MULTISPECIES: ABC transporter substrate-binding protein [unclassified Paenibacillus]|uniref:ABC transporter substrate-binding protein n=1 Tax=unclassified Paenibacillus TaxID=185978 RepID=UPI002F3F15CD
MLKTMSKFSLTLILAFAIILSACSKNEPAPASGPSNNEKNTPEKQSNEVIAIDYWGGWTGPDGDVMREMVDRFNSENPDIKVTLTTLQWTPLFEKLVTQFKVGAPPSLMAMHPQDVAQFANMGILDPVADQVGVKKEDFDENAWNYTFYDSKQYGIPLDMHMHGLYMNTEMFEAAGLDPAKSPKTGEELIEYATKLTIDNNGKHPNEAGFDINNVKQWGIGLQNNHHAFYLWYALMTQQGEAFLSKDAKETVFDMAKSDKAWQFLQDLIYKHQVAPKGQKAPFDDFKAGLTAMAIDGPWQLAGLEGQSTMKWATGVFPQVFDKPAAWGSGHILTFPVEKDAKKREAAMKLAKWITEHSEDWAKSGNIPSKLEVQRKIISLPGREAFAEMMPYEVVLPNIPKTAQVFSATAPSPILTAGHDILLNNQEPSGVSKELKKGIDAILSQP